MAAERSQPRSHVAADEADTARLPADSRSIVTERPVHKQRPWWPLLGALWEAEPFKRGGNEGDAPPGGAQEASELRKTRSLTRLSICLGPFESDAEQCLSGFLNTEAEGSSAERPRDRQAVSLGVDLSDVRKLPSAESDPCPPGPVVSPSRST